LTRGLLAVKLPYVYQISRDALLVLRLARTGRRNQPKFRLVAAEQGKKLDGKVVEILGHYEPAAKDKPFVFDREKVQGWLAKGGMPSNTVAKLLNMNGFDLPVHIRPEAKPRKKTTAKTMVRTGVVNEPAESAPASEEVVSSEASAESVSTEASTDAKAMVDKTPDETEAEQTGGES